MDFHVKVNTDHAWGIVGATLLAIGVIMLTGVVGYFAGGIGIAILWTAITLFFGAVLFSHWADSMG